MDQLWVIQVNSRQRRFSGVIIQEKAKAILAVLKRGMTRLLGHLDRLRMRRKSSVVLPLFWDGHHLRMTIHKCEASLLLCRLNGALLHVHVSFYFNLSVIFMTLVYCL